MVTGSRPGFGQVQQGLGPPPLGTLAGCGRASSPSPGSPSADEEPGSASGSTRFPSFFSSPFCRLRRPGAWTATGQAGSGKLLGARPAGPLCWHLACSGSPVTLPGCGLEGSIASCRFAPVSTAEPPAPGPALCPRGKALPTVHHVERWARPEPSTPSLPHSHLTPQNLAKPPSLQGQSEGPLHAQCCVASAFLFQKALSQQMT